MPSLNVIISGSTQPFERELNRINKLAQQTTARLNHSFGEGGHLRGGVVYETAVLMRELSRGNFTRLPGSITILAQRMGLLKFLVKDTASASRVLADAWAQQAEKAGAAAIASTQKASSSMAALYADGGETQASLAAAIADEEKAAADTQVMLATQAKAIASQNAAAAAEAEAGAARASVGPLGIVGGVLVAIGAGAYAANKLVRGLTDTLAGVKAPESFEPDYIVKRLQKANATAEIQRQINDEVSKSVRLYNSAAEAGRRSEQTAKAHYDHLRKMNELRERAELNGVTSVSARQAIRQRYSDADLEIGRQERAQQIADKRAEKFNLEHESTAAQERANKINVPSRQQDENDLRLAEEKLRITREAAATIEKAKHDPGFLNLVNSRDVLRAYNSIAATGVSGKDLNAAEKQVTTDRTAQEMAVRQLKEQLDKNSLARTEKEDLSKQAAASAGKAAEIGLALPTMIQNANQANQDAREEAAAQLASDKSGARSGSGHGMNLNSQQRIGAYAQAGFDKEVVLLEKIHTAIKQLHPPAHPPVSPGRATFGGVHQ